MAELKSCPFCGSDAILCTAITMQHEIAYVVKCDNLECVMCSGGTLRQTISQAENAWNTRTPKERGGEK